MADAQAYLQADANPAILFYSPPSIHRTTRTLRGQHRCRSAWLACRSGQNRGMCFWYRWSRCRASDGWRSHPSAEQMLRDRQRLLVARLEAVGPTPEPELTLMHELA